MSDITCQGSRHWFHVRVQELSASVTVTLMFLLASGEVGAHAPGQSPPGAKHDEVRPKQGGVPVDLETVTAAADVGDIRESSPLAMLMVDRAEIEKYGDHSLADVLKRLPGVTVVNGGGQDSGVRMRGLGGGYTQVTIDGDPAPAGFSIDSISPEIVERIEVIRSGMAGMSAQGIAGTINIVLRKAQSKSQREFKLGVIDGVGPPTYSVSGRVAGGSATRKYSAGIAASQERRTLDAVMEERGFEDGAPILSRTTHRIGETRTQRFNITPRFSWRPSENNALAWEGMLGGTRADGRNQDDALTQFGASQTYPHNRLQFSTDTSTLQSKLSWQRPLGAYSNVDAKLSTTVNRRNSSVAFLGFDEDQTLILERDVNAHVQDIATLFGGKFTSALAQSHAIAAGWDGEYSRREEDRIQRDLTPTGLRPLNLDEEYRANLTRLAVYVQDEWQVSPSWSTHLGLRWEGLETSTEGSVIDPVDNRFSVLSPALQSVWKLAGKRRDQVRLSLGRTYKSPQLVELVPRRFIANNNSATNPDTQGEPDLRPELAWGIDLAYERFWGERNSVSASAFARRIDDVIIQNLINSDGVWVSMPENSGKAKASGIEVDGKISVSSIIPSAPDIDVSFNASKNWSRVESVPGPNNRLARQNPFGGSLSITYQSHSLPLTIGGAYTYEQGSVTRISRLQAAHVSSKKVLDVYGVWKFNRAVQLRLSVANVLGQYSESESTFFQQGFLQSQRTRSPTSTVMTATFEVKL